MQAGMKHFSERNPLVVGAIGCAVTLGLMVAALEYDKVPGFSHTTEYSAYFAEAGGLKTGNKVQVSGYSVGKVTGVRLDGNRVRVSFRMDNDIRLGETTEAAIKTETVLGAKQLAVTPRGQGHLHTTIPLSRTTSPYQLPDAIGDLTTTISGLDTGKLSDALGTLSQTLHDTPADLKQALDGVTRLSTVLNQRDDNLRNLLGNAQQVTSVLSERSKQIGTLIIDANTLLTELRSQDQALEHLMADVSEVSRQISGLVADNRKELGPALEKVNTVLDILDRHKKEIQTSLTRLDSYAMSLGESVGSGPFFKAYLQNLLPGQFLQPFVQAAFGDMGLNPDQLLPSQLPPEAKRPDPAPAPAPPALPALPGLQLPAIPGLPLPPAPQPGR